jgi:hypothetical protein
MALLGPMTAVEVGASEGYAFWYTPHAPEMVRVPEPNRKKQSAEALG